MVLKSYSFLVSLIGHIMHAAIVTVPLYKQVWYPDSAQKTADALQEYDREGLPLIILANWRGFSGGKRDLFEGILQAGASIVESLRRYRWPVMVYMPPGCDLRGGAWVVIDSQINSSMVEMYAGVPSSCLYADLCIRVQPVAPLCGWCGCLGIWWHSG